MSSRTVTVTVEDARWRNAPALIPGIRRAVALARERAAQAASRKSQIAILLTGDGKLRALNRQFRGKDKPTNVLSFSTASQDCLGDIAIAYGVTAREAREQHKNFAHHAIHLAVHGTLHLLGHDHQTTREAKAMEQREKEILSELGIADPYAKAAA
jgi:probable rRNA maturation factor